MSQIEQIQAFFQDGLTLGIPEDRLRNYLKEAGGDAALAFTNALINESNRRKKDMPTKFYNQPTEQELHSASLEAENEIAEKASLLAFEKDWPYTKAQAYVIKTNPDLAELAAKGYISEKPAKSYAMTSLEAGAVLAEKVKKLQKAEGLPFNEAHARIFQAEENAELVRNYTHGD